MKKKISILLLIIIEVILFYLEKNYFGSYFSIDRFLILSAFNTFFWMHFLIEHKKMYEYIFNKRYYIGIILLTIITIRGYHGSSISVWNDLIQPNTNVDDGGLLIGIPRLIRGDEYIVSTPMLISQISNNFSSISNILMGREGLITMFPALPCYNLSIISNIFNIPYLILPFENAFALSWYGRLFAIFFGTFELFMIITDRNKLYSLTGAFLIALSPVCSWWSLMPILAFGAIAIILLNLFFKTKHKFICTILFSIIGINYIMILYPAWQVPFGYVYLALVIWIIWNNKEKINKKDSLYLLLSITIIGLVIYFIFKENYAIYLMTTSTVYPGARISNGGYGYKNLFNYIINIFFPCIPFHNPCEYSNFISLYPIPIISGIYYKIKKNKSDLLITLLIIAILITSIWNYLEIPFFVSKFTLLSFSTPERSSVVVGYICIILLIRIMHLYEKDNKINKKEIIKCGVFAIIFMAIITLLMKNYAENFLNTIMIIIMNIVFVPIIILILLNNRKTNKILSIYLIVLSLFVGGTINPISKGIDAITEKPVAKEIQKIVKNNKDSKWITVNSYYAIANYLVANGASTINSTNYYPNLELWNKLDKDKQFENIYNRYAHILIELTSNETTFELVSQDSFKINLNIEDIRTLDVDYIVSQNSINNLNSDNITFNLLYEEDGIYIYKINYKN